MTETPKEAARRLGASFIAQGYQPSALHAYTTRDGAPLYYRMRLKHPDTGEKQIRPFHANGAGFKFGEPNFGGKPKPLYRLHEIAAADPALPVWWVEGEQKADALARLGLVATTAGGANDDEGRDFEPLRGRQVIVWPDNDDPGRRHAQRVAARLKPLGCTVELVDIEALALDKGGDVVDWLDAHPNATAADLMALARLPAGEGTATVSGADDWPEPAPLPAELPNVEPFDFKLLPNALRPWISDIADRVQCPPDFPAVAAMVALGSVLGRKVFLHPKQLDDWYEAPNLWGAIVGRPGVLKSPALNEALRPLRELEGAAAQAHAAAMRDFQEQKARREIERAAAKGNALKAAKQGKGFDTAGLLDCDDEEPALRRYVVNDSSVEALGEVLRTNSNGVLAYRDELVGLLRQLDEEGNEGMRSFYLTAWAAKEGYTFDRIGRGLNRRIDAVCLSVLGSIQPAVLGDYLREAVRHGGGDGLIARFGLLTWPDVSGEWRDIDRLPDSDAKETAFAAFRRFDALRPKDVGAERHFGDVYALRFEANAYGCFRDWREQFECEQRSAESHDMHPALTGHREKYRKLVPALALICHLADTPDGGPVSTDALLRALEWTRYAESHARRAYASVIRADVDGARELLKRIQKGAVSDGFRAREVYRNGWARLGQPEQVKQAAELLAEFDYLREEREETLGRWTSRYFINPRVLAEAREYFRTAADGH